MGNTIVLSNCTIVWYKCPDVTIVQYDITIVVPWQLPTQSQHDYLFCYCPLVDILFEVLRIDFYLYLLAVTFNMLSPRHIFLLRVIGNICHHTLCYLCVLSATYVTIPCAISVLSATYVTIPCAISVCYRWHMSPYLVLSLCAIGDICHLTLCYHCVLSATYVTLPCAISVCYRRRMSPYLVLSLCAIGNICCWCFSSLNFVGLQSIVAIISTQFAMTSSSENKADIFLSLYDVFAQRLTILQAIWDQACTLYWDGII